MRRYYDWLAATSMSAFGDRVLFFALGWAASAFGAGMAALVLTQFGLPRTALLLVGGAIGDRWGPRRVLVTGQVLLCLLTATLAGVTLLHGISGSLLMATAVVIGTVDAFCLPCAGSYPRLLVPDDQLPKALALRGSATQLVLLTGGPAGGVLVAIVGLGGVALADSLTFAVCAVALVRIQPLYDAVPARQSLSAGIRAGVRVAVGDPALRAMLVAVGMVAGFVLPMTSLCLPLLVRASDGGAGLAGVTAGATAAGTLLVTLLVARRGPLGRPGVVAALGPLLAGLGMAGVAMLTAPVTMAGCALLQGAGVGLFTAHVAPMFATSSPRSHLTRLQSMLSLAQSVPLLVANNVLGVVATQAGARAAALTRDRDRGGRRRTAAQPAAQAAGVRVTKVSRRSGSRTSPTRPPLTSATGLIRAMVSHERASAGAHGGSRSRHRRRGPGAARRRVRR